MSKKDNELIEIFKKIAYVHFLKDYSSIDYMYPPHFVWDKFNNEEFVKNKEKISSGDYKLYAHFPFCQAKCKFCRQFSMPVNREELYKEYVDFLIKELRLYTDTVNISSLVNIYLAGGTPTLFPLDRFFESLYKYTHVSPTSQINVESTPESLNYQKLKLLKKKGVNRLVIGLQSLDPHVLKSIGRPQRKSHFIKMYYFAKEVGISTINLELVAGLPGQTFKSFLKDLDTVINMRPESIHVYGYMNVPTTVFYKENYRRGKRELEYKRKMMVTARRILKEANYFSKGDDYCLNNKSEFRNQAFVNSSHLKSLGSIALGLSALGYLSLNNGYLLKTMNTMDYKKYRDDLHERKNPIIKTFLLNQEEKIRAFAIRSYRYGFLEIRNRGYRNRRFNSAINYLKRQKQITIQPQHKKIKIIFSPSKRGKYFIHSKIFYSPQVLEKCKKVIEEQYPGVDPSDLDFLS